MRNDNALRFKTYIRSLQLVLGNPADATGQGIKRPSRWFTRTIPPNGIARKLRQPRYPCVDVGAIFLGGCR